jgi:pentatricopeptide repeat protein
VARALRKSGARPDEVTEQLQWWAGYADVECFNQLLHVTLQLTVFRIDLCPAQLVPHLRRRHSSFRSVTGLDGQELAVWREWKLVQAAVEAMPAAGVQPDVITYTELMAALSRAGRPRDALAAFDRMTAAAVAADRWDSCRPHVRLAGEGGDGNRSNSRVAVFCKATKRKALAGRM